MRRRNLYVEVLIAAFAATQKLFVDFVGRFMVAEFVAVGGLLYQRNWRLFRTVPELRRIFYGFGVCFFGLLIADIVNGSSKEDFLRGWASILFGMSSMIFLTGYLRRSTFAPHIFLASTAIASLLLREGALDLSMQEVNTNYFKVRFVPILEPALALAATILWRFNRTYSAALIFVSGLSFFVFDARSMGVIFVLASGLLAAQILNVRPKPSHIVAVAVAGAVLAYAGYVHYVDLVLNYGFGGSNAQQLAMSENPYNPVELLLIGRAELRVTATAIADKPLLGYGSWAKDETGRYTVLLLVLLGLEERLLDYSYHGGLIPAHSVLLTSWLWAGVFGLIGILIVYGTMLRLFLASFWGRSPFAPVLCIYFTDITWAFLFSPFGSIRTSFPFIIALLIMSKYAVPLPKSAAKREKVAEQQQSHGFRPSIETN